MQAELLIDLAAITANWRLLAARAAPARTAAVVKADAYGLGVARVAPALAAAGCGAFFVARLEEGTALRALLPEARIFVLDGVGPDESGSFVEADLVPVLNHDAQLARWAEAAAGAGRRLPAALHVDTGMTRLGFTPARAAELAAAWPQAVELVLLMSHFACADEPDHPLNAHQLAQFRQIRRRYPAVPTSLAASSGIFLGAGSHFDLVRPGVALWGVNPTPGRDNPMRPVVTLRAPILQLHRIDAPATVGYGATRTVPAGSRLATVAAGYADGILRAASERAVAHLDGHPLPFVGRVSMDLITLDAGHVPDHLLREGAMVELIGGADGVDRLAAAAGTIGYEILTRLGGRCRRCYREGMPQP